MSPKIGYVTYIIVAAVSIYHLMEAIAAPSSTVYIRYIILWSFVVIGEVLLYQRKNRRKKVSNTA